MDCLEIGSGAGFFDEFLPGLISTEVFYVDNVKLIADARCLPFKNRSLNTIVMTDVLHHIPDYLLSYFRKGIK